MRELADNLEQGKVIRRRGEEEITLTFPDTAELEIEIQWAEEQIAKALHGNYKPEHLFVLKRALAQGDFHLRQIQECDAEMEAVYADLSPGDPDDQGSPPPKPNTQKPRKNRAHVNLASSICRIAGVDLTAIDGIDALTAQTIVTEIGT